MLHRVRVTNAGTETVHFDLATGDDPPGPTRCWADGQWLAEATTLSAYELGCVGTEAGALCTAPGTPPPTRAYVADRFVARDDETADGQPLKGRCALALGWTDLKLPAGQSFEVMFAMGPTAAGETPAGPAVAEQDWQRLASLRDLHPEAVASVHDRLRLASLAAGIEVQPGGGEVAVTATYQLQNTGPDPMTRSVYVPFAVGEAHPFPHEVEVSADEHVPLADGVLFGVTVEGHAEATVTLRYRQQVTGRSATFVATGARVWGHPLDTAELRVSGPAGFVLKDSSYEMAGPVESDRGVVYSTSLLRPFHDRDLVVRW